MAIMKYTQQFHLELDKRETNSPKTNGSWSVYDGKTTKGR